MPQSAGSAGSARACPGTVSGSDGASGRSTVTAAGIVMLRHLRRWFFFRVSGVKDKDLIMHLVNAGNSSFPEAWEGYQVRRSRKQVAVLQLDEPAYISRLCLTRLETLVMGSEKSARHEPCFLCITRCNLRRMSAGKSRQKLYCMLRADVCQLRQEALVPGADGLRQPPRRAAHQAQARAGAPRKPS